MWPARRCGAHARARVEKHGVLAISLAPMLLLKRLGPLVAALAFAHGAAAQTPQSIGSFKDWDAYSYGEKGAKVCYVAATPLDSDPKNVRRGEIFFLVAHRPKDKVSDEVNLHMGYPLKPGTAVRVEICGRRFELDIKDENAWTKSPADDAKLVAAMIRGNEMIVRGTSRRGTRTVDRYSLLGFTAAHKAIDRACGVAK